METQELRELAEKMFIHIRRTAGMKATNNYDAYGNWRNHLPYDIKQAVLRFDEILKEEKENHAL